MSKKRQTITQGVRTAMPQPLIKITPPLRFGVEISNWKSAITSAENFDYPMRARLLDIYSDIMLDGHLTSVIEKRRSNVTSAPLVFLRKDGTQDERMTEMTRAPWFCDFVKNVLDAKFWGFSLFQFDIDRDGWPTCQMVRRKHVDPIRRQILGEQYDTQGPSFDEFFNLLFVGDPYDIGMLAKAARYVIYKNNDLGDWAEFAEIFGMPIREYTYDATDEDSRSRLLDDASSQGAAQVYIHPEGTGLNLIETTGKTGSLDVYKGLATYCDGEISKLFLGNTLTTDVGERGTQALGTVHKKGEDSIMRDDRLYVLGVLNYQLVDILSDMGFDVSGGVFAYEESEDVDLEKQLHIVQGLHAMGLSIDDDYLYEKFGVAKSTKQKPREQKSDADDKRGVKERETEKDLADKRQRNVWQRFFDEGAKKQ